MLAGCSGDPAAYGITGPGGPRPAAAATGPTPDDSPTPGAPSSGTFFGPSNRPMTGNSGFWGYNN